jgi:cytochrome c553
MKLNLVWLLVASLGMVSCMDQYNPLPYWKQFKSEREVTSQKHAKLTDKGELPPKDAAAGPEDPISAKSTSLCSSCHGAQGMADGAAAGAMNPKPRNFHDRAWQAKVSDEHIASVIKIHFLTAITPIIEPGALLKRIVSRPKMRP